MDHPGSSIFLIFDYPQLSLARAIRRDSYVPSTVKFVQGGVLATHFKLGDRSQHHYLARYGDGRAPWSSILLFRHLTIHSYGLLGLSGGIIMYLVPSNSFRGVY